ncbi:MAG TPA: serine/threonine-protein kinase, partial [Steroidobacteraceae bacterium]|nr:serine/threonine-protein kinase [Steroidobacteraceae bacterium]
MTPEEFTRLRSIFDAAAELDAEQRERFLADEASRNPEIVVRVRRLLGAPAEPLARVEQTIASAFIATPGSRVDRYTLLAPLGDGGMGEVWLAEQQEPIRRRVALKMIKAGMDTKQVIARFDAERQALAMLSHPAVAQVLDAGATEAGRPYFVMEYVEGAQIDRYCDRKQLDVRKRLRLFQRVCAGVQHAHDRTIIHRDLKPSNVLVTEVRGEALPKIIDFGIAKALARDASPSIDVTQLGEVVGTPDYMSPEQLARGRAAVDTRSDVYSLGVILYELLTGSRPFARSSGRDRVSTTMAGSVRADPPPPSESLRRSRTGEDIARSRQARPSELVEQLRGDLDWIVLKAVAADPQRRYRSPL